MPLDLPDDSNDPKARSRRSFLRWLGFASAAGTIGLATLGGGAAAGAAALTNAPVSGDVGAAAAANPTSQSMFQVNAQHTGRSPYAGPRSAVLLRSFEMALPTVTATGAAGQPTAQVQSSSVVGSDGTIYVSDFQGNLFALQDPGSGSTLAVRWRFHLSGQSPLHGTPAVGADGTVYLGFSTLGPATSTPKAMLYALQAPASGSDPRTLWSADLGAARASFSPTLGPDGTIYALNGAGKLFAVSPNGSVSWTANVGPSVVSSPALASDGTVYVACTDGKVYAVTPPSGGASGGMSSWSFDLGKHLGPTPLVTASRPQGANGIGTFASPTIGPDGTIYVGGSNSNFYAITPDGQLKWLYEAERELAGIASTAAISADGQTLYFGANKGGIYAVAATDGSLRWRFNIYGSVFNSPTLDKAGVLYTGSTVGHVFGIDSATGKQVFDYAAGFSVWTAPAIRPDGSLVVATQHGRVELLAPQPSGLPTTGGGGAAGNLTQPSPARRGQT